MSMGVYITGMEMPKSDSGGCMDIRIYPDGAVYVIDGSRQVPQRFKAVPVPPHGRLIDADALERDINQYIGGEESRSRFHHWVQVQNTVFPGDKEENR